MNSLWAQRTTGRTQGLIHVQLAAIMDNILGVRTRDVGTENTHTQIAIKVVRNAATVNAKPAATVAPNLPVKPTVAGLTNLDSLFGTDTGAAATAMGSARMAGQNNVTTNFQLIQSTGQRAWELATTDVTGDPTNRTVLQVGRLWDANAVNAHEVPNLYLWNGWRGFSAYEYMVGGAWGMETPGVSQDHIERNAAETVNRIIGRKAEGAFYTMHMVNNGYDVNGLPEIYFIFEPYAVGEYYRVNDTGTSIRLGHTAARADMNTLNRLMNGLQAGFTDINLRNSRQFSNDESLSLSRIVWSTPAAGDSVVVPSVPSATNVPMTNGRIYLYAIRSDAPGDSYTNHTPPSMGRGTGTDTELRVGGRGAGDRQISGGDVTGDIAVNAAGRINSPLSWDNLHRDAFSDWGDNSGRRAEAGEGLTQILVMGTHLPLQRTDRVSYVTYRDMSGTGLQSSGIWFAGSTMGSTPDARIIMNTSGGAIGAMYTTGNNDQQANRRILTHNRIVQNQRYEFYTFPGLTNIVYTRVAPQNIPVTVGDYAVVIGTLGAPYTTLIGGVHREVQAIEVARMSATIGGQARTETMLLVEGFVREWWGTARNRTQSGGWIGNAAASGTILRFNQSTVLGYWDTFVQGNANQALLLGAGYQFIERTAAGLSASVASLRSFGSYSDITLTGTGQDTSIKRVTPETRIYAYTGTLTNLGTPTNKEMRTVTYAQFRDYMINPSNNVNIDRIAMMGTEHTFLEGFAVNILSADTIVVQVNTKANLDLLAVGTPGTVAPGHLYVVHHDNGPLMNGFRTKRAVSISGGQHIWLMMDTTNGDVANGNVGRYFTIDPLLAAPVSPGSFGMPALDRATYRITDPGMEWLDADPDAEPKGYSGFGDGNTSHSREAVRRALGASSANTLLSYSDGNLIFVDNNGSPHTTVLSNPGREAVAIRREIEITLSRTEILALGQPSTVSLNDLIKASAVTSAGAPRTNTANVNDFNPTNDNGVRGRWINWNNTNTVFPNNGFPAGFIGPNTGEFVAANVRINIGIAGEPLARYNTYMVTTVPGFGNTALSMIIWEIRLTMET